MQLRERLRLAATLAVPLAVLAVAITVACADSTSPTPQLSKDWASDAIVSLRVRNEVQYLAHEKILDRSSVVQDTVVSVRTFPFVKFRNASLPWPSGPRHPRFRQFRDKSGNVHSLAVVRDANGKPARRLYYFSNGKIRLVYSPEYVRVRGGWQRSAAQVIAYDEGGKSIAQVRSTTVLTAATRLEGLLSLATSTSDMLSTRLRDFLLPTPLHAAPTGLEIAEEELGPCLKFFMDFLAKDVTTAGWITAGYGLYKLCRVIAEPLPDVCYGTVSLGGNLLASVNSLVESMDQLIRCDLDTWIRLSNPTNTPFPPPVAGPQEPTRGDATSVIETKPMEDYILSSEVASGSVTP